MPYPLLSTFYLLILICIICYYHLKNLGLTSLAYYHIVTINVLPKHALSPCLSRSLLYDVHRIICYSIMHGSTVYSDPFSPSRIFCNASSPIFNHALLPYILYNQLHIIHRMFRATERKKYFIYLFIYFIRCLFL